jgi:hypothetical protein
MLRWRLLSIIAAHKNTDSSANQAADYGEDYGLLDTCGGRPAASAKQCSDRGKYADSFGCDGAARWSVKPSSA